MIVDRFVEWLLESEIASIRYLTLRELLDRPEDDPEVQAARVAMRQAGPIPSILAHQTQRGSWEGEHSFYTPKYTSTHWSMMLLAELQADPSEPRLRQGADFMLADTQTRLEARRAENGHGWECFWGNLLRYVLQADMVDDPRLEAVVAALAEDAVEAGWRCEYNDEFPCAWGAARALWGLAALPPERHTPQVETAIHNGLNFLLDEYDLLAADYPAPEGGKTSTLWSRLNFPLFYQADVIFVLRVLAELDELDHPGAQAALDWLEKRRGKNGRWRGASPYRRRTWEWMGEVDETNRWVSLQAAMVLKRAGRFT
jgi:hypothetical protein